MAQRVTRRAALAGSAALPMVPAAAVARAEGQDVTEARIEALLEEYRRRIVSLEAQPGDLTLELYRWEEEPFAELAAITPTTLRGLALQIEAHAVRQGEPHPFDGVGAAELNDHARAILGLPTVRDGKASFVPSRREGHAARVLEAVRTMAGAPDDVLMDVSEPYRYGLDELNQMRQAAEALLRRWTDAA